MVATLNLVVDVRGAEGRDEVLRNKEVVDSPSQVPFAGGPAEAPPRIALACLRMEVPERVHKARREEAADPVALLEQEARGLFDGPGAGEVNLPVRRVDVAADDDALALLHAGAQEAQEFLVEVHLVAQERRRSCRWENKCSGA